MRVKAESGTDGERAADMVTRDEAASAYVSYGCCAVDESWRMLCRLGSDGMISYVRSRSDATRWAERRWRTRPFGLPRDVAGYQYLVTYARCDEEALQGVRDACRTQRSVLVRRGEPRPFIGPNAGVGVSAAG